MANKHCLLEKPFTVTTEDAKYLINLAKERNLFLMEVRDNESPFSGSGAAYASY